MDERRASQAGGLPGWLAGQSPNKHPQAPPSAALTDRSSVRRSSSMRDCASAYVSAARLRMTDLVNWLDTTCGINKQTKQTVVVVKPWAELRARKVPRRGLI